MIPSISATDCSYSSFIFWYLFEISRIVKSISALITVKFWRTFFYLETKATNFLQCCITVKIPLTILGKLKKIWFETDARYKSCIFLKSSKSNRFKPPNIFLPLAWDNESSNLDHWTEITSTWKYDQRLSMKKDIWFLKCNILRYTLS